MGNGKNVILFTINALFYHILYSKLQKGIRTKSLKGWEHNSLSKFVFNQLLTLNCCQVFSYYCHSFIVVYSILIQSNTLNIDKNLMDKLKRHDNNINVQSGASINFFVLWLCDKHKPDTNMINTSFRVLQTREV